MVRLALLVITAAVAVACGGSFNGDIDGQGGPLLVTALYGQADQGDGEVLLVVAVSYPSDCERLGDWMEDARDLRAEARASGADESDREDAAARLRDNDSKHGVPNEFWIAQLIYGGDELDDGDEVDVGIELGHMLAVSLNHQREAPDYQAELEDGDDDSTDHYGADEGEARFGIGDGAVEVQAEDLELFSADDDDADTVGTGTLQLHARECPTLSAMVEDMFAPTPVPADDGG